MKKGGGGDHVGLNTFTQNGKSLGCKHTFNHDIGSHQMYAFWDNPYKADEA